MKPDIRPDTVYQKQGTTLKKIFKKSFQEPCKWSTYLTLIDYLVKLVYLIYSIKHIVLVYIRDKI